MKEKNIYISGKITGVENFAEIFASKEQELTKQGHNVFNPAKHPDMFSWQQFMELDLKALSFCDSIYMMKGWETSRGAKLELEEAMKLGLEIIYESPEQNISIEQNVGDASLKSISEIEERKNELSSHSNLLKDYVKDFEDKLNDDSLSDSDLIKIAKAYIQELQNLHHSPEQMAEQNKETEFTVSIHPYLKEHYPDIYGKLLDEDIHNMEYFSELAKNDEITEIKFTKDSIYSNDKKISFEDFVELAKEGIQKNIESNLPLAAENKKVKQEIMKEKLSLKRIEKTTWNLLTDYYIKKYESQFKKENLSKSLENIIGKYEEVRKNQRKENPEAYSFELDTPESDALGQLRLKYSELVNEKERKEIKENWSSPNLKQSFNPYSVWDRTEENEKVFKDWFEENKKNLTEKDLKDFNLSSVFSLANYLEEDYKLKVPEFGTALGILGMAKVLMPFVEESKKRSPNNKVVKEEQSIMKASVPQKKGIGYKVFYLNDGKLYPPMVQNPNGESTPMNSWIEASAGEVAGKTTTGRPQVKKGGRGTHSSPGFLAYRPGWHLGEVPIARQFSKTNPENGLKELFPAEFVWAECEYAADVDYQKEAMANGYTGNGAFRHSYAGLQKLPENGSYRYRTNPDPNTEEWIITGKIKVNRILTNDEVDELCRKAGKEPQKREPGSFGEIEKEFIKKLGFEYSKTKNIDESFSNAIKNLTTPDIAKLDSIVKVKLGEKYSRSDLMQYLEEKVASKDKLMEKKRSEPYERGR